MKTLLLIIAISAVIISAGCNNTPRFAYSEKMSLPDDTIEPLSGKTVVVPLFKDNRGENNDFAMLFLYAIPLFPYGYTEYEYPEIAKSFASIHSFMFNPKEDLAKAAAISFNNANIFKETTFALSDKPQYTDYILEGRIDSLYYKGRKFSYGLSYVGSFFWLLGAPSGTSLNRLAITVNLKDKKQKVMWSYTYDNSDYITQWIYAGFYRDCDLYSKLMQQAMEEAISKLKKDLKNNPALLN